MGIVILRHCSSIEDLAQVSAEHLLQFPSAVERRAELGEVAVLLAWDNNAVPAAAVFHCCSNPPSVIPPAQEENDFR